jgi:hypothetical protein
MMQDGLVEISKKASKTTATMKMIYTMINEVELYRDDSTLAFSIDRCYRIPESPHPADKTLR